MRNRLIQKNPGCKYSVFQVDEIEVVMPNQHYFTIDMTKMGLSNKDEVSSVMTVNLSSFLVMKFHETCLLTCILPSQVLLPLDNPSGNITGTLRRKQQAKLWRKYCCCDLHIKRASENKNNLSKIYCPNHEYNWGVLRHNRAFGHVNM